MPNLIPVMDDLLGRHWNQPADIRIAPMDDKNVILTSGQLERLHEYSSSTPTGVYPGKCWKRVEGKRTLLAWYGDETLEHSCPILFREVIITDIHVNLWST